MHPSYFLYGHESLNTGSLECAEALTGQVSFTENFDLFRLIGKKHTKKKWTNIYMKQTLVLLKIVAY